MSEQLVRWILEQSPVIAVLAAGGVVMWRELQRQNDKIEDLLNSCWERLLSLLDDRKS